MSGQDNLAAYGDAEDGRAERYARTKEFLQLTRRLWTEESVTFRGEHYTVEGSTVTPRPAGSEHGRHSRLYFGGASAEAEQVSAAEADVQLFWGGPLEGISERIGRLTRLAESLGRAHAPLEFGLRITTLVRETTAEAWRDAEAKVAAMAQASGQSRRDGHWGRAVGQQRLLDLAGRGEVLDSCLYTTPGKFGGGAGTTWLVGRLLQRGGCRPAQVPGLGITHFVLRHTPYQHEAARVGDQLLSRLREPVTA